MATLLIYYNRVEEPVNVFFHDQKSAEDFMDRIIGDPDRDIFITENYMNFIHMIVTRKIRHITLMP